jgi:hypothetical protein
MTNRIHGVEHAKKAIPTPNERWKKNDEIPININKLEMSATDSRKFGPQPLWIKQ